ncbi:hypothetical protein STAN_5376 [Streptomyces sp. CBMAI 2042]|nr:hypothetical protein STAN_5376 [Streptomyces sp. CBMAI 2042]
MLQFVELPSSYGPERIIRHNVGADAERLLVE